MPSGVRPFYHLYLVPADAAEVEAQRNEARYVLQHISPRLCGMMLEMLYIPLGRSGSEGETYLIYEQPEEFERALSFAKFLDVTGTPDDADGWRASIACMISVLEQGAVAEPDAIERCEKQFAAVSQNSQNPGLRRWAAAIFAGKLAADFRYDFEAARRFYVQAAKIAEPDSIEAMVAEWWRADALVQESATTEANEAYEDILDVYTTIWPKSHIITRSYAILKKNKKR